ncbi:MAG TPA: EamA family transporter RarD [Chromobacteriaceae bacterium]|nr:EamA family transporter RarD [Chromobacteriaceae bacterium]
MSYAQAQSGKGISQSVAASVLFAFLSGYVTLLKPLDGLAIYAWRVVWTFPGVLLVVSWRGQWEALRALLARISREKSLWLVLPLMAALLGSQLWLFMWAPLHGEAMPVAMGYFLLPFTMVLAGRLFYRERLYRLQWLALACAMLGVAHELWLTRQLSWSTVWVMTGYPPYFMLRRWARLDAITGMAVEIGLMLPAALWMLFTQDPSGWGVLHRPVFWLLLPGLGVISTVALVCYLSASRALPLGLMGILGYVEPALLFVMAITLLGEPITAAQWLTYGPIWLAVLLITSHTVLHQRSLRHHA